MSHVILVFFDDNGGERVFHNGSPYQRALVCWKSEMRLKAGMANLTLRSTTTLEDDLAILRDQLATLCPNLNVKLYCHHGFLPWGTNWKWFLCQATDLRFLLANAAAVDSSLFSVLGNFSRLVFCVKRSQPAAISI